MHVLTRRTAIALATAGLLTCAVVAALGPAPQAQREPARGEWLLSPQLARGQEYSFTGSFDEKHLIAGVESQRSYRVESYVLVLEHGQQKWDVAFLTVLGQRAQKPGQQASPSSVRLELAEVDAQGRLRSRGNASLAPPTDGPPTAECGAFVEAPRRVVGVDQVWEVAEAGRPTRTWRVAGTETVQGSLCVELRGHQQSDDWDRPRADSAAWRRKDAVWVSPQLGVALKVERVMERRDPAHTQPTYRSTLRYELDARVAYPGKLFDDARTEIERAVKFQEEAAPLLRDPAQNKARIDALLKRIAHHLEQPPTVGHYRKAVQQVQHRVEAARRGEVIPQLPEAAPLVARATLGQRVPDFVATELVSSKALRLQDTLGKPVVLMFYNPASEIGKDVLRFGQALRDKTRGAVHVLALAASGDDFLVRKQHAEMKLSLPVLDGRGLFHTYGIDATPRLIVLDAAGIYRGGFTGWGTQVPREVSEEIQRWLPR